MYLIVLAARRPASQFDHQSGLVTEKYTAAEIDARGAETGRDVRFEINAARAAYARAVEGAEEGGRAACGH